MSQDYLRDKVYPEIYSGYSAVLDAIYSARHLKTDTDKQDYLQYLQTHAQDLWKEYQSEGHERRMQGIPIDYAKREVSRGVPTTLLFSTFSACTYGTRFAATHRCLRGGYLGFVPLAE